jgi:trimeric autotransporter adhesin
MLWFAYRFLEGECMKRTAWIPLLFIATFLYAAVPSLINFQGRLTDPSGNPISTAQSMVFRIYSVDTGGATLFSETQSVTPDAVGIYNVLIGNSVALGDIFNQDLWLEVTVNGQTLSPRYRLTSSPYAMRASIANDIPDNTVTSTKIANGAVTNADINASAAISLSKLEKDPSVTGTLNDAANPVDWTRLKNVPADFADGADNTGTATSVADNAVGMNQIVDSTVTLSKLDTSTIDTHYVTTGTAQSISGVKTITGNWINTANPWADNEVADDLTLGSSANVNAGSLTSGTLPNARLDGSSVTLMGNTFNGSNGLVKLNGSGNLPALDGSALTGIVATNVASNTVGGSQIVDSTITLSKLDTPSIDTHYVTTGTAQTISGVKTITGNWVNTANPWADNEVADDLTLGSSANVNAGSLTSGTLPNARLDGNSVTLMGNAFNGSDGLVKLDSLGNLPALDGSALTGIVATNVGSNTVGMTQIIDSTITLSKLDTSTIDTHYVTTGTAQTISGVKTITGNWVNTVNPWADNEVADDLTLGSSANVNAGALTSGTLPNARLDGSSVTLMGNTFNGTNGLVKLESSGNLPALDGSALTGIVATNVGSNAVGTSQIVDSTITLSKLDISSIDTHYVTTGTAQTISGVKTITGNWINTANPWADNEVADDLTLGSSANVNAGSLTSGTLPNARLDASSVTLMGNTFNGTNGLVKLDSSGNLPALDGSALTGIIATNVGSNTVGTSQIVDSTITLSKLDTSSIDTHYVTTGTAQTISGVKTITGNWINTANPWADNEVADDLTLGSSANVNAGSLTSGTLPNARLDGSSVTLMGNTFNGTNGLVKLDSSGNLPALDGSALTGIVATNVGSNTVGTSQILDSTITLSKLDTSSIDTHYVTTGTAQAISGVKIITGNWINTSNPWADNEVADDLTLGSSANVNAGALTSGTLPNARLDGSSVTLMGNTFNGSNGLVKLDSSGNLPVLDGSALTGIVATNVAANTVGTSQIVDSTITLSKLDTSSIDTHYVTTGTAQTISGVKTITGNWINTANPWADNEVADDLTLGSSANVNAGALTSGTLPNARLDASSVTLMGNTFNGTNGLVKLDSSGNLPALDGSALTGIVATNVGSNTVGTSQIVDSTITLSKLDTSSIDTHYVTTGTAQTISGVKTITGNWINTANPWADNEVADDLTLGSSANVNAGSLTSGTLPSARLDGSSVTLMGNSFNGTNGLVKLDSSGNLPALDGSALTGIVATNVGSNTVGTSQIVDSTITLSKLDTSSIDTHYVTTGTAQTISGVKTITGNWVNTANPWADNEVADDLTLGSSANVNAGSLTSGTLPNARLDGSSVTLMGNAFNGTNGLVKLDSSGNLPALDGSALTGIVATNVGSNTVGTSQIVDSTITLSKLDTASIDTHYVTTGTAQTISGVKTITGNWINTANPWADNEVADDLTLDSSANVNASALTSGTLPSTRLDSSSVTLMGNTFNGSNGLVKLDPSGNLPALDGSALTGIVATNVGSNTVGGNQIVDSTITLSKLDTSSIDTHYVTTGTAQIISGVKTLTSDWVNTANPWADNEVADDITLGSSANVNAGALTSGTLPNARLDASSVTLMGNTFNGTNGLVKLDSSGNLPVLNGAALTGIVATNLAANSVGTNQIVDSTVTLSKLDTSTIDTHYVTTGTVQTISGVKTITGDWVNTTNPWADNEVANDLTLSTSANINAGALTSGTLPNARLDSSSVTLMGNIFNGTNGLVKLDSSGNLPALNGAALTGIVATSVASNSIGSTHLINSTVTLSKLDTSTIDTHYVTTGTAQTISGVKTITGDWVNTANPWADNEVADDLTLGSSANVNAGALTSGMLPNARLDASSVTLMGNTFNGTNGLVKLDSSGNLPALNGAALTGVVATSVAGNSIGSTHLINSTVTLSKLDTSTIDTHYVTTGTAQIISGVKTITGDWVNTTNPWADNEVANDLTLSTSANINAGALTSGTLPNARLDASSVTLMGNTFNGTNGLVKLDSSGNLPALNGSALTGIVAANLAANSVGTNQIVDSTVTLSKLDTSTIDTHYVTTGTAQTISGVKTITGNWVNTTNPWADNEVADDLTLGSSANVNAGALTSGTLPNARLDASSVTLMGNTFNGTNGLVKLDSSGNLPALNGAALTGVVATSVASNSIGSTHLINSTVTLSKLDTSTIDTHYVTTGTAQTISGVKTLTGDWVNTTNPWADNEVANDLTLSTSANINAAALTSGTLPNARLDSSSVTLMGNTFNGANGLVQLDSSGNLPALSGASLSGVPFRWYIGTFGKSVGGSGNTLLELGIGGGTLGVGSHIPMASTVTIRGLCVAGESAVSSGSLSFVLMKNGSVLSPADTGANVTLNTAGQQYTCSSGGTAVYNAGDRIGVQAQANTLSPSNKVWAAWVVVENK